LREILTTEVDCLLVEQDDIEAWVQALLRLQNQEIRVRLGQAAQEKF